MRLRQLPQVAGQDVVHAKVEHAGGELEAAVGWAYVAKLFQGEQDTAGGGPGQPGCARHLGQGHDRLAGAECPDHIEAAGKRLDEVRTGVAASHAVSWCSVSATPCRLSCRGRLPRAPTAPGTDCSRIRSACPHRGQARYGQCAGRPGRPLTVALEPATLPVRLHMAVVRTNVRTAGTTALPHSGGLP